jgi:outer membrane protein assembly factor BamE (lipoprotein component of BamABCDE complex)
MNRFFLLIFLLASCTTTHINGQYIDSELVSILNQNAKNKRTVISIMGPATFSSQENDNIWYYVQRKIKSGPLKHPTLTEQQIIKITFDTQGNVVNIEHIVDQDKEFTLEKNISFTYGKGESGMTHIIKNLGRFTKKRIEKR